MLKYSNLGEDAANGGSAMEFVATSRGCGTMDVPASDCSVTNTETVRKTPLGSKFFKSMGRFLVCMVALFAFWASNNNAMAAYTGSGTAIDPWFIADGGGGSVYAYIEGSVLYIKYAGSGVSDMADFWCVDGNSPWWYSPKLNNIQSVDIQSGVTSIGSRAFMDCQYMQTVNIPQSVTKICAEAFKNCISVATFVIPCSINTIQGSAFEGCTNLKTVVNLAKTPQTIEYNPTSMCVLPALSDPFPTYTSLYVQPSALSAFQSWSSMFGGKVSALTNSSYGYLEPTAPTGITGTDTICLGSSTWLTVSGNFGSGAYQWYQGSCGGPYLGSVLSVNVTPTTTTTYYVRGVGISPCDDITITPCDSVTVHVDMPPTAPTGIDGITSINHGDSTELTAMGGSEGSGCIYQWYSGTCGGTFIDTGITITVKPSITTTYYVRRVGNTSCHSAPTACASVAVTVNYTLTFDPQDGTVSPESKNVVYGEEVGTLPVPERCGYEFEGWFTGRNGGGTEYLATTVYATHSNTTVYAKWKGTTWEVGYPTPANITATFINNNTLIISGTGNMQDWTLNDAPWDCIKELVETVVISSGVKTIGEAAFVDFSVLTSVAIPHGLTGIGANCFQNCCSLSFIDIPSSVGFIGDEAFAGYDCNLPLTDVILHWANPFAAPISMFAGNDVSATNLHVPQGTECAYAAAAIWEDFVIANATRTITASSGSHGTISLSGVQNVNCGDNLQFIFTPDAPCYEIDQILINGVNEPDSIPNGSYTFENVTANQTISVNFKIKSYVISATSDVNGNISPEGDTSVLCGANQTFIFTPNSGYQIDSVFVDDEYEPTAVTDGYYTFANVGNDHSIHVTFAFHAHTIMVINGSNGSIMPATGAVLVNHGGEATFTFTPDAPCYEIDQILVNGINEPDSIPFGSYTFENVMTDQTLTVNFKIRSYTIEATAGVNGSITPNGNIDVICGANQTFVFTPDFGYQIAAVYVDDIPNAAAAASGYYTFENVTNEHTINVTFAPNSYTITINNGSNGSVTPPAGTITVNHGGSATFTFTPDAPCYEIDQVLINGMNQPSAVSSGTYTFTNISANQSVLVNFKIKSITISATADAANGSINPEGDFMIVCGAEQTFTATPAPCQEVYEWLVNDVPKQQGGTVYITEGIQENDVVSVTFKQIVYTIEAIATTGGTITPSGIQPVGCGGSMEFCYDAEEGRIVERVFIDGAESMQALTDGCYTFSNVQGNHTIFVIFQFDGIEETAIQSIKVYPNPAKNQLHVTDYDLQQSNYSIYNVVGQTLIQGKLQGDATTINVESLANGMYFLKIDNKVVRFVKE